MTRAAHRNCSPEMSHSPEEAGIDPDLEGEEDHGNLPYQGAVAGSTRLQGGIYHPGAVDREPRSFRVDKASQGVEEAHPIAAEVERSWG